MEHKLRIDIKWENDKFFEVSQKTDDAESLIVVRIEEDSCVKECREPVMELIRKFMEKKLKEIFDEMVS